MDRIDYAKKSREEKKIKIKNERKKKSKLTDRQKLFCQYYIKNFNSTIAYIKAYNCDYLKAKASGSRLLSYVNVKHYIAKLKADKHKKIMINENDIIEKHINIAFSDMTDFIKWGQSKKGSKISNYIQFLNSENVDGGIVKEVKQGKDGISVKLEDRQKSLNWLTNFFEMDKYKNKSIDIQEKKLKIEEQQEYDNRESIENFLNATKSTNKEIEKLFEDEE